MADEKKDEKKPKKVIAVHVTEALTIGTSVTNHIAHAAEWAKHPKLALELTHAGGMGAFVRWNSNGMRHEALVQCHRIMFEPVAQ